MAFWAKNVVENSGFHEERGCVCLQIYLCLSVYSLELLGQVGLTSLEYRYAMQYMSMCCLIEHDDWLTDWMNTAGVSCSLSTLLTSYRMVCDGCPPVAGNTYHLLIIYIGAFSWNIVCFHYLNFLGMVCNHFRVEVNLGQNAEFYEINFIKMV